MKSVGNSRREISVFMHKLFSRRMYTGSLQVPGPATRCRGSGGSGGGRGWAPRRVHPAASGARYKRGYVQWLKAMYREQRSS